MKTVYQTNEEINNAITADGTLTGTVAVSVKGFHSQEEMGNQRTLIKGRWSAKRRTGRRR